MACQGEYYNLVNELTYCTSLEELTYNKSLGCIQLHWLYTLKILTKTKGVSNDVSIASTAHPAASMAKV